MKPQTNRLGWVLIAAAAWPPPPPASAGRVQDGGRAGRPPHQQRSARTAQGAESADRIRKNVLLVAVLNLLSFSALSG